MGANVAGVARWRKHEETADYLASVGFFEGFTDEELRRVAALGHEVQRPAGALLMDQGDVGQVCYVILEGSASVYVADELVAGLDAGAMVGEMALVDHRPRRASVRADTDVRLLAFDAGPFRRLLEEMPKARDRVLGLLMARLRPAPGT